MATYLCSPRAHWLRDLTDEERLRMTACAPPPWANLVVRPTTFSVTNPAPETTMSGADVERIARRTAELVVDMLREAAK